MKRAKLTWHALHKAAHRYDLAKWQLKEIALRSVEIKPPRHVKQRNKQVYGKQSRYYFYDKQTQINFAVREKRLYLLVLTVFKRDQSDCRVMHPGKKLRI